MILRTKLAGIALLLAACYAHAERMATLPQQDAPAPHWPWWLRVLAVIGVLVFVRIVARAMRGAGRPGPGSTQNDE